MFLFLVGAASGGGGRRSASPWRGPGPTCRSRARGSLGGGGLGGGLLGGLRGGGLLGGLLLGGGDGLLGGSVLGLDLGLLEQLLLPLGQRLGVHGGDVLLAAGGLGVTLLEAGGDRVGDHAGQQRDGADRVVVARDRVGDLVGIAVGVQDSDDGDVELLRLVDGEVLLVGVHDPEGGGGLAHVADAAEGLLELVLLATHHEQLLLGAAGGGHIVEVDLLELLEAVHARGDGLQVGEHAAQPALVHVGHAHAGGLLLHGLLRLLLGA